MKGSPMIHEPLGLALLLMYIPLVPAWIYLYSADPGRRRRAWRLVELFSGRRAAPTTPGSPVLE